MKTAGLRKFVYQLEKEGELIRIKDFVDPILEITEFADRAISSGGPALLFENTGTPFPLLINAFGSARRMSMALHQENLENLTASMQKLARQFIYGNNTLKNRISRISSLISFSRYIPSRTNHRGRCQDVVIKNPDLTILPFLKCWPNDGGRFITLPVVHTRNPFTGTPNAGMYRMQIFDSQTTGMHWQMHKTGANHYRLWKEAGKIMPVSVVLGGDPVYTYAATAPLPENIDEYILAGFLTQRKIKMVKCITNDLYVPEDADIVIEGYVDPSEPPAIEGPFGDHTGFYSLAEHYPKFHVTCITHASDAIYPATVVGIPPKEDMFFAEATERLFLMPLKFMLNNEITDLHLPSPGVAHNLVLVTIDKKYPGQGLKIINSLLGTGQMMFSKYIIALSKDVDIRNYKAVMKEIVQNSSFKKDLIFTSGPLDVLDHACEIPTFGGKMGIDATKKLPQEATNQTRKIIKNHGKLQESLKELKNQALISSYNIVYDSEEGSVLVIAAKRKNNIVNVEEISEKLKKNEEIISVKLTLVVDEEVEVNDLATIAWLVLSNSDPVRDHYFLSDSTLLIDGTSKVFRPGGFTRQWPEIVCSSIPTIKAIDKKWTEAGMNHFVESPSLRYLALKRGDAEFVSIDY